jgi:peptide/nickel transport system substrate-binding protein
LGRFRSGGFSLSLLFGIMRRDRAIKGCDRVKTLMVFSNALTLCLALAGCSGPTATTRSQHVPQYGGQLRIGAVGAADTVLPMFVLNEDSLYDLSFMYDGLIDVDPDFNVVPRLAKTWDVSKDGLTYSFHLRKDATWSDGRPLTADDQLFEYELTTNPATSAPNRADYDVVESVRAPDRYTVVYRLKSPNAAFLPSVVGGLAHVPLPRHIYGKIPPRQLRSMDFADHLVVSGGYTLKEWRHDDHLVLESNHAWWHGRPYIDEIYIKEYVSDAAALIALQHGDVDTTYRLSTAMWLALKDDARYTPIRNPADQFDQYVVNMKNPILSDLQVRKAIMYAWDRQTQTSKLFHGQGVPAVSPIPWAIAWAFDPKTESAYPFDPKRSARLLDADGWKLGPDGYRYKNGKALHFMTGEIAGSDGSIASFELFQANLKSVGIKTDATTLEFNVFSQREQDGQFDLDFVGYGDVADPDPFIFLSSKAIPPNGVNFGRYEDPQMDLLIDEGRRDANRAKRAAIYKKLQQLFVARLPSLVDDMPYYRNVMNKRIHGFEAAKAGSQFTSTIYTEPSWYVAQ